MTASQWSEFTVKDVCESVIDCVNKTAPVVAYETPYRMIRTSNVKKGVIDTDKVRFVEKEVFEKWTRRAVPQVGDVVLTREAPLGDVGMLTKYGQHVFLGQRLMQYRADPEKLDNYFLLFALQESYLQGQLKAAGSGSTVEHIRVGDAENLKIRLPDLETQKDLSSILKAYDNLIENNNRRIAILEEMAQSLYREWFVKFRFPGHEQRQIVDYPLGLIPDGWEVVALEAIANLKYGKMPKKDKLLSDGSGIPVYSGYRITGSYPEEMFTESKVIVVARGVGGTGDVKMSPDKCWLTNLSIALIETPEKVKKTYLYYFLKACGLRKLDSGSAQSQITIADLKNQKIILPPYEIQSEFDELCESFWIQVKNHRRQIENLKKQRDLLLPKLIRGQIDLSQAEQSLA